MIYSPYSVFRACAALVFTMLCFAMCTGSELTVRDADMKKAFEWGEYEDLIAQLEPYLLNPADSDSMHLAECRKYLGVAYYAKGRISEARSEFLKALRLNSNLTIDKFYVTPAILGLFHDAAREISSERLKELENDSLLSIKERQIRRSETQLQDIALQKQIQRLRILAGTSYAVSAISAAAALWAFLSAEKEYERYLDASRRGDLLTYEQLGPKIRSKDAVHITGVAVSALFLVPGTYFLRSALKLKKSRITLEPMQYHSFNTLYGAELVIRY